MSIRSNVVVALLGVAGFTAAANADAIASFSYDDLAGSYVGGNFSAVAVDNATLQSSGEASRLVPTEGNSVFEPGFVSALNPADFSINISVVIDGVNHATGAGSFTATDADGDTITGNLAGEWNYVGTFITFSGNMSNVFLNDNGASDNTFNGTDASSTNWSMNLPGTAPFDGAIVTLTFGQASFFGASFENAATGVTAQILPAPGAAALLGLGLTAAGRRRR